MNACDQIQVSLALRPEDRSPAEEQRVRSHLSGCAACAALVKTYAEQDRVIRTGSRVALTASQRSQLLSAIGGQIRRRQLRVRALNVIGTLAMGAAVIGLVLGLRALSRWDGRLIPEQPLDSVAATTAVDDADPLPDAAAARIRGVDFAVVEHEMTPCVTLASEEERCAPGGQVYVLVKMYAQNSEKYPTATGPDIRLVHQGQFLPKMVFLPQGKPPRSACTPTGYYEDTLCHFWVGAVAPEGARAAELEVRAEEDGTVYVWPLGRPGELYVSQPGPLVWPTARRDVSGWSFHDPRNPDHPGVDIAANEGDPVVAVAAGSVIFASLAGDYGNLVVVEHGDGWSSYYGQLSEILVAEAQELHQGELLGRAGSTGHSSGPHLHFELRHQGVPVDPLRYLPDEIPLADLLIGPDDLPGTVLETASNYAWDPVPMPREGELDGADWIGAVAQADGCIDAWQVQGPLEVVGTDGAAQVVYVLHAAYRFDAAPQAQHQYEDVAQRAKSGARERLYGVVAAPNIEAQTFAFTGASDEDVIYWLVAVDHRDVHLLMVDVFFDETLRNVFDAAVSRVVGNDGRAQREDPEAHLAAVFVQDPAAVCGWEVLGESDTETYVWAICQSPSGTAVSAPAVLAWSSGEVGPRRLLDVRMPRDGSYYAEDVRDLFPPDLQQRMLAHEVDMEAIWEHIEEKLETITGTVVDNDASAQVMTLEDVLGARWYVPWRAAGGIYRADGSIAHFRDLEQGLRVEVVGFVDPDGTSRHFVSAVRMTILDEAGLAPGVHGVVDCAAVYPGAPGCLQQQPLVGGRLAFVDERPYFDGRPVMLDLEQGGAPTLGDTPDWIRGWSPSGAYLLTGHAVYDSDGELVASLDGPSGSRPAFWAPVGAFGDSGDWLVRQTEDGGLEARSLPGEEVEQLLPPNTLAADGRDSILVSGHGQLAWTPGMDRLAEAEEWAQELRVRPVTETRSASLVPLSDDIRQTYYRLIAWAPGTSLILAGRGQLSASLWVDGVPLVTIDVESGEITDLGVTMLVTPEAFDWHPTQPGLLALAAGGGRFINQNKRLGLLDVTTGDLTYLTDDDEAAFAPAWSPDGSLVAYAAVPAWSGTGGDGESMQRTLEGRAINLIDAETRHRRAITEPGDAIDGWPQWSADGEQLLYTRQHAGQTDVRVVTLDGDQDHLLVTGLADLACYYGGCAWDSILAYTGLRGPE